MRALTRIATEESEPELLELSEHATAAQLERIVRGLRRIANAEAAEIQANRHLSLWWEGDGSLTIHGNLPPEDGAILEQAFNAMHDRLFERTGAEGGSAEPPSEDRSRGGLQPMQPGSAEPFEPRDATNADALVAMADAALGADRIAGANGNPASANPRQAGARYEIALQVDARTLCDDEPGTCRLHRGSAIAPETARRLACDSSVVPVIESEGSTLSVGRKTRRVPPALARALRARDGTCRFPGCENHRFGEAHHVQHWAHGGETSLDNLVWLCRRHHRLVHEGGFSVGRAPPGQLVFRDRFGVGIPAVPDLPGGTAAGLSAGILAGPTRSSPRRRHRERASASISSTRCSCSPAAPGPFRAINGTGCRGNVSALTLRRIARNWSAPTGLGSARCGWGDAFCCWHSRASPCSPRPSPRGRR